MPMRDVRCETCGKTARTHAPKWRFCSQKCKDAFWNKSDSCSKCGEAMWRGSSSANEKTCLSCRREMREHGTLPMYRRGKCRCNACRAANTASVIEYQKARRAEGRPVPKYRGPSHKSGGHYGLSRADKVAIFDRDGWVCQLCDLPVDPTLHFNDLMAATLDHIEPQSATLIPDHSPSNLRLAHRICNSRRGNRTNAAC